MSLVDRIEELLRAPAPALAHMEHTLTEGYAEALALEAERTRLERRLGEVARGLEPAGVGQHADELRSLAHRLTCADGELTRLRALLGTLQDRTRRARAAALA